MSAVSQRTKLAVAAAAVAVVAAALTLAVVTAVTPTPATWQVYNVTAAQSAALKVNAGADVAPGSRCIIAPDGTPGSSAVAGLAGISIGWPGWVELCEHQTAAVTGVALTGHDLPTGATIRVRTESGDVQTCTHSKWDSADGQFGSDGWTCTLPPAAQGH